MSGVLLVYRHLAPPEQGTPNTQFQSANRLLNAEIFTKSLRAEFTHATQSPETEMSDAYFTRNILRELFPSIYGNSPVSADIFALHKWHHRCTC
jgi:hypothetical protein